MQFREGQFDSSAT
nr:unnamed protein product [Callosobruchus chinensis]